MSRLIEAKVVRRHYARHPNFVHRRMNWEFLAVTDGAIRPRLPDGPRLSTRERTLWLFAPDRPHGWAADVDPCTILIASFDSVPPALVRSVEEHGWCGWQLEADDCPRLLRLTGALVAELQRPRVDSAVRAQHLLWEFALLSLERPRLADRVVVDTGANAVVQRALDWFHAHLASCPNLEDMAHAVGVSAGHLRRLVRRVEGMPPRGAMDHIRMTVADRMLITTRAPLPDIARACGYRSSTAFARAYKQHRGVTPGQQRGRARFDEDPRDRIDG